MASYGELRVYQVLSNKPLLREVARLLGATQQLLRKILLKADPGAALEEVIKYVPPGWNNFNVSDVRQRQKLIDLLVDATQLSRKDVANKLNVHGSTLITNEFTFPWPEQSDGGESGTIAGDPDDSQLAASSPSTGSTIFGSYSHKDRKFVELFRLHLKPLEKWHQIDFWDDSKISPGAKWRSEIADAIDRASAAVLFVSANFLASDFIETDEIPPLLVKAQQRGTVIFPLIVGHCLFKSHPQLSKFQACNDPSKPLAAMGKNQRDKLFVDVVSKITKILKNSA